jgi:hypothetical protein
VIWLTWRQHRVAVATGLGIALAVAAYLVVQGMHAREIAAHLEPDLCVDLTTNTCPQQWYGQLGQLYRSRLSQALAITAVPALAGALWGAPLVARELETGTNRFAWAQSITRHRWLLVKVAGLVVAMAGVTTILGLAYRWYTRPASVLTYVTDHVFGFNDFDVAGIALVSYGIAALMIGVAAGTFTRKVVPAILLTLLVFTGIRVGVGVWLRPHYMEPVRIEASELRGLRHRPLWILSTETVTGDGRVVGRHGSPDYYELTAQACEEAGLPPNANGSGASPECAGRLGFHDISTYHPEDRFRRFQVTEAAIFLALSAGLLGASVWWVRRRLS